MSRHSSGRVQETVVIGGWGLVTPLGRWSWETFSSLLAGRCVTDRLLNLSTAIDPVDLVHAVGAVGVVRHTSCDPVVALAECAAREALCMADLQPRDVQCILGVSKGAVHAVSEAARRRWHDCHGSSPKVHGSRPVVTDPEMAVALGPQGYLAHHLQARLGISSPRQVVAACASSLTALHQARKLMLRRSDSGRPRRMLVITAEASLLPSFIHSYRRLGVLAPLSPSRYRGRPLDCRRDGFMLAETGAAVVLERVDRCRPGHIELVDTAVACESCDLVRIAPAMPALSRVAKQLLAGQQVDLLHPHATGTADHDAVELTVLAARMGNQPDVYACKGALGHGLGAAGLVSLVVACMCAKSGRRPPMPWLIDPLDPTQTGLAVNGHATSLSPKTHAVFAAGFGGHVAGSVLRRH